jgi:hypothetical protein
MIVKTLNSNTINLVSKSKELLFQAKSLSLVAKKKKHDNESTHHFQDWWATKLPSVKSIVDETNNLH